jgi:hypothetical protein
LQNDGPGTVITVGVGVVAVVVMGRLDRFRALRGEQPDVGSI